MVQNKLILLLAFFAVIIPADLTAQQTWTPICPISISPWGNGGEIIGSASRMLVLNGIPTMAYDDYGDKTLKFIRANDADGTSWGMPVTLDVNVQVNYISLELINGKPAISYYKTNTFDLKYISATDADGLTWASPLTIDYEGYVGNNNHLQEVNGNPAIVYEDETNGWQKYIRANNSSGTSWGTAVVVGQHWAVPSSLGIIDGKPAIVFFGSVGSVNNLFFIRADDVNGNSWNGSPVLLEGGTSNSTFGSLAVVDGFPAVAYGNEYGINDSTYTSNLKYIRATDISGTNWGASMVLDSSEKAGYHSSLQVINGNPAISYVTYSYPHELKYIRANNSSGALLSDWAAPIVVDSRTEVAFNNCLRMLANEPAICYYDGDGRLKYVHANDASGNTWNTPIVVGSSAFTGLFTSLQFVNGSPAMCFYDHNKGNLVYVNAKQPNDFIWTLWNTPVLPDSAGDVGSYCSMQIINGKPGIAYWDKTNADLKYVYANDPDGTLWGTPVVVDNAGSVGEYISLLEVNGNPTISYYDRTNGNLKYIRAANTSGSAWGNAVSLDVSNNTGMYTSMKIVNGNPAIAYFDSTSGKLKYIRSSDINGTTWGVPVFADNGNGVGKNASLQVVNGAPAISFYDYTNNILKYVRANDAAGTTWGSSITVDGPAYEGGYNSMQIIKGRPAIAYSGRNTTWPDNFDLKYVEATDNSGTVWGTPLTIDLGGVNGLYTSLINIADEPAIAYYNQSSHKPFFTVALSNIVFPVNISSFNVYQKNRGVQIEWRNEQETSVTKYEVERSKDGLTFMKLGFVLAKNNSGTRVNYNLFDPSPFTGSTFYRIKTFENTGAIKYTKILRINMSSPKTNDVLIYPTVINDQSFSLQLNLPVDRYTMRLINQSGQVVLQKLIEHRGASSTHDIELPPIMAKGLYRVNVTNSTISITRPLIKN